MNNDTIQTRIVHSSGLILFYSQSVFFSSFAISRTLSLSSSLCFCKANTAQSKRLHTSIQQTLQNKYQRTSFNSKQIAYACWNLFMVDWTIFSRSLFLSCMAWRCSFQVFSHFYSTYVIIAALKGFLSLESISIAVSSLNE